MRIGLYGGSFDPIHRGHVEPLRQAADTLGLQRVFYLPTGQPPHKPGRQMTPAWRRFAMVELALLAEPTFQVSAHELREDQPSYTFETVQHFQRVQPDDEFVLLIGSDSYRQLDRWREWQSLLAAVEIAVLARPGADILAPGLGPPLRLALTTGRVHRVDNRPLALSSSEIRRLLAIGAPEASSMLHHLVLDYIGKYELYTRDK